MNIQLTTDAELYGKVLHVNLAKPQKAGSGGHKAGVLLLLLFNVVVVVVVVCMCD